MAQSRRENLLATTEYLEDTITSRAKISELKAKHPALANLAETKILNLQVDENPEIADLSTNLQKTIGKENVLRAQSLIENLVKSGDVSSGGLINTVGQTVIEESVKKVYQTCFQESDDKSEAELSQKDKHRQYITYLGNVLGIKDEDIANSRVHHSDYASNALTERVEAQALDELSNDKAFMRRLDEFSKNVTIDKAYYQEQKAIQDILNAKKASIRNNIQQNNERYTERKIKPSSSLGQVSEGVASNLSSKKKEYLDKETIDSKRTVIKEKTEQSEVDLKKQKVDTKNSIKQEIIANGFEDETNKSKSSINKEYDEQLTKISKKYNEEAATNASKRAQDIQLINLESDKKLQEFESRYQENVQTTESSHIDNIKSIGKRYQDNAKKINKIRDDKIKKLPPIDSKKDIIDIALKQLSIIYVADPENFKKNAKEQLANLPVKEDAMKIALKKALMSDYTLNNFANAMSQVKAGSEQQAKFGQNAYRKENQGSSLNALRDKKKLVSEQEEKLKSEFFTSNNQELSALLKYGEDVCNGTNIQSPIENIYSESLEAEKNNSKSKTELFSAQTEKRESSIRDLAEERRLFIQANEEKTKSSIQTIDNDYKASSERAAANFESSKSDIAREREQKINILSIGREKLLEEQVEQTYKTKIVEQSFEQFMMRPDHDFKSIDKMIKYIETNQSSLNKSFRNKASALLLDEASKLSAKYHQYVQENSKDKNFISKVKYHTDLRDRLIEGIKSIGSDLSEEKIKEKIYNGKISEYKLEATEASLYQNLATLKNGGVQPKIQIISDDINECLNQYNRNNNVEDWKNKVKDSLKENIKAALKENAGEKKNLRKIMLGSYAKLTSKKLALETWRQLKNNAKKEMMSELTGLANGLNGPNTDVKDSLKKIADINKNLVKLRKRRMWRPRIKMKYQQELNDLSGCVEKAAAEYYRKKIQGKEPGECKSEMENFITILELRKKIKHSNANDLDQVKFIERIEKGHQHKIIKKIVKHSNKPQPAFDIKSFVAQCISIKPVYTPNVKKIDSSIGR